MRMVPTLQPLPRLRSLLLSNHLAHMRKRSRGAVLTNSLSLSHARVCACLCSSAVAQGGTELTLRGANFAPTSRLQCVFVGAEADPGSDSPTAPAISVPAAFVSFETVTCDAPDAFSANVDPTLGRVDVAVSTESRRSGYSAPLRVRYSSVVISSFFPIAGPTSGDTAVTMRGVAMRDVSRCRFGGSLRDEHSTILHHETTPLHKEDEMVICRSPGHPRGIFELSLSVSGIHWSAPVTYEYYEQPRIAELRPRSGRSAGGTILRVLGYGLDSWPPPLNATATNTSCTLPGCAGYGRLNTVFCRFGKGADAPITPLISRTSTVFKCRTPPHAVGHVAVEITLNSQDYAYSLPAVLFTFYPEPILTTGKPKGGPIEGGSTFMIEGTGFMPTVLVERGLLLVTCRFGDAFHPDYQHTVEANYVTDTQVNCVSQTTVLEAYPDGRAGPVPVTIALNGGSDATTDDVDFVGDSPQPVPFLYYRVALVAIQPVGMRGCSDPVLILNRIARVWC